MNKRVSDIKAYMSSLMRVCFLVLAALIIPRLYISDKRQSSVRYSFGTSLKLGIENLSLEFLKSLDNTGRLDYRVGLITNHSGLDQLGRSSIEILQEKGLQISKVFIPESDFYGFKNNRKSTDDKKIPIYLLPGQISFPEQICELFTDLDVIFFDMQDNGLFSSSVIATLLQSMQGESMKNKRLVILDRPNFLGPAVEGALFYGYDPISIPFRHGLTVGELALYCNSLLARPILLSVVPMKDYNRAFYESGHSLKTNIDIQYNAPFLDILKDFWPIDIGLQTNFAHRCFALPQSCELSLKKWFELRALLKRYGIETSVITYKKKKTNFTGLQLLAKNPDSLFSFAAVIATLQFLKDNHVSCMIPSKYAFSKKMTEFLEGKCTRADLNYEIKHELKQFLKRASGVLIYKPEPSIIAF